MPHLFVPVIFKSCYVCRYPLPSSAWIAIIAPSNHMEYALLRCPFIFVKRMKNRFRSELYSAVLFCRDALDFGYFSVLFVHVLGRGGKGIFLWKHFRDWILWHTYFKVQKSILQTSIYRQTLQQQSSPSPPISIERRVVSRWWFTVRKIFSLVWWIEVCA